MAGTHVDEDPALLLADFVNTLDIDAGTDGFAKPDGLAGWLAGRGLVPRGTQAGDADLRAAAALREGLREAMSAHHGPRDAGFPADLEDALEALPLRVTFAGARPMLVPLDPPGTPAAALARVAAAIMDTVAAGTWLRLKVCQEGTCRWAFLDTSKNRSRAWCSMSTCGNRTKTRTYRARRRTPS